MKHEVLTLSNGKRVSNFSSPHEFVFTDGSKLGAVSDEDSERLKVDFIEKVGENGDVELSFDLSMEVVKEMAYWTGEQALGKIDVVFCPMPMIVVLREWDKIYYRLNLKLSPFRAIRIEDRIKKLVSIEKQCL